MRCEIGLQLKPPLMTNEKVKTIGDTADIGHHKALGARFLVNDALGEYRPLIWLSIA